MERSSSGEKQQEADTNIHEEDEEWEEETHISVGSSDEESVLRPRREVVAP